MRFLAKENLISCPKRHIVSKGTASDDPEEEKEKGGGWGDVEREDAQIRRANLQKQPTTLTSHPSAVRDHMILRKMNPRVRDPEKPKDSLSQRRQILWDQEECNQFCSK